MRAAPTSATHVVRRYSRPPCDAPPRCRQRGRGRAQTARREESSCPTPATALLGPEHASARAIARVHASAARVRPERRRTSAAAEEGLHRPHASATASRPSELCRRGAPSRRRRPPCAHPIPIHSSLCAAYPRTDYNIRVIPEDELLQVQLATADD
ncbi:hypothetical protein PVAP13_3NG220826 [Panicum virgatum]|uniref:Uncharacterized protein n=1 Tax=Panicum virgatum TaxID=38727 RepID=A0A8T0UGF7_PANVG|nr:hypothetical protein PVAP13_3NG220826 [Panicum virgatum]